MILILGPSSPSFREGYSSSSSSSSSFTFSTAAEKIRKWISDKPIQDIATNIISKPITWIACGGKCPYDFSMNEEEKREDAEYRAQNGLPKRKEGKCVEGGIKRDSNGQLTLLDKYATPSRVGVNRENVITPKQLAFMKKWELHDSLQEEDFFKHLRDWVTSEEAQKSIFKMLSERNSQILRDLNNPNLTDRERLESYERASRHLSIVDAIRLGTEGAAQAVKNSYYDLIAIAKNPKQLVEALDRLYDAGLDGTLSAMGNALENYWDDYQTASPEEKAKIVGYISGEIAMALIPAGGILKGATGLVTKAGKSSKFLSSTKLLLDTTIGKFGEKFGKDFIKIVGNAHGTFRTPQELTNAIKKKKIRGDLD